MARRKSKTLTEVELEFMQVVWAAGEATSENVRGALQEQGRPLSDGSVRKVLSILVAKGYLSRRREGRSFVYKPEVPSEEAKRNMVLDLLGRAFGGSAAHMVATLIDSKAVRECDIERIRQLIADREKEGRK